MTRILALCGVLTLCMQTTTLTAQNTVGLTAFGAAQTEGYVLFSPMVSTESYLIDKCGEKVHEWTTSNYRPALSTFLLEDGSLLKTGQLNNPNFDEGGSGGILQRFDWNGNLLWSFTLSDSNQCLHHDICPLPNGNVLCIVWERYSKQEAIAKGKDSSYANAYLWSEKIVELQPLGPDSASVVWEWKLWDHLIQNFDASRPDFGQISAYPERVNINYFPGQTNSADWIHLNSIDYNAELDQILVSSHTFNEIWIIDHSTTTLEAAAHTGGNAGKGGDILYRWGNPQAYQRGTPANKLLFGQHHATWVPTAYPNAGKILIFNNGLNRPGMYSSIDMVEPPLNAIGSYDVPPATAYLPLDAYWSYTAPNPSDFYSSNISGVYPLANGGFMVTSGTKGLFFELDSMEQTQWSYVSPIGNSGIVAQGSVPTNNLVFRCNFYPTSYAGISGQVLAPMGEIELNPASPSLCESLSLEEVWSENASGFSVFPNPCTDAVHLKLDGTSRATGTLYTALGESVLHMEFEEEIILPLAGLEPGIYYVVLHGEEAPYRVQKLLKH